MGQHRIGRRLQHRVGVVGHRAAAVGGEPVADRLDRHALGHVVRGGGHVTGPGRVNPGLAVRDLGVVVVVDVHVGQAGQVLQGPPGLGDLAPVGGVEVEDAVLHQPQADALAVVVEDGHLALVLGLPRHGPRVPHRVRVLVHEVLTPGNAGGVDRVRDGVLPAAVVERVGEVRPGLVHVRDVAVVQRLDQLGLDQLAQHVHGHAHEHVERQAAAQLGQGLVHRVERGHLDLAVVLLGEVVHAGLVDVGDPVVDLQGGPGLGLQAAGDRLVLGVEGPFHRVVRARQRDRARARQGGCAGIQQRAAAQGGQAGPRPLQEAAAGEQRRA